MLSKYSLNIANEYEIKVGNVNKLIPNLGNKKNYVIHYRNLSIQKSIVSVIRNEIDKKFIKFLNLNNLTG